MARFELECYGIQMWDRRVQQSINVKDQRIIEYSFELNLNDRESFKFAGILSKESRNGQTLIEIECCKNLFYSMYIISRYNKDELSDYDDTHNFLTDKVLSLALLGYPLIIPIEFSELEEDKLSIDRSYEFVEFVKMNLDYIYNENVKKSKLSLRNGNEMSESGKLIYALKLVVAHHLIKSGLFVDIPSILMYT